MELSKQVVSLSLANKLKELGVKQESLFWYSRTNWYQVPSENRYGIALNANVVDTSLSIAAFTVAELGEMLPDWLEFRSSVNETTTTHQLMFKNVIDRTEYPEPYCTVFYTNSNKLTQTASTEAEARGLMLAYLIENKLITP